MLRRKAELALTEASALEEAREAQLEEQAVWNATLAENQEVGGRGPLQGIGVCRVALLFCPIERFSLVCGLMLAHA